MAYYAVRVVTTSGALANIPVGNLNPYGIYRTTRCRMFDASGNVTGYGFTVNPTWQMIETLLRFQFKVQQPPLAGLTASELALFDWPAMVAHAERNAFLLANGAPRFAGNFAFAADAKLANMMETQLRNCRSYKRERGGVISFVGDDARASVFIASQRAVVPGTLNLQKKDLSTAPNVFIPQYRELNIPAISSVASAVCSGRATTFTTVDNQPFFSADYFAYAGSADDADFAGCYRVGLYINDNPGITSTNPTGAATQIAPPIPNQFNAEGGPVTAMSTTGGYLGTEQSRFKQYAPDVVRHRAHQKSFGQVAPGISGLPRVTKVFYDLGDNTFDQTNRLMQFREINDLGPDVQPYVAPIVGSLTLFAENVDLDGNCAGEIEPGDVITLDATVDPVFAGEYVVQDPITDNPVKPGSSQSSTRQLALQTYQPTAYTDTSYPPGDSYQTLPTLTLPTADMPLASAYYIMQATPSGGIASDGTVTIGLPDLSIWWAGQSAPTAYAGVQLTEIPFNAHIILYLHVTNMGTTPTMSVDTSATNPPVPLPAGTTVIYIGSITSAPTGGAPGRPLPRQSGSSLTPAGLTALTGYLSGAPQSAPASALTFSSSTSAGSTAVYQPSTATPGGSGTTTNANGPCSGGSGNAGLTGTASGSDPRVLRPAACTWSGFPAVTTTAATTLTIPATVDITLTGAGSATGEAVLSVTIGSAVTTVFALTASAALNAYTLAIPAGTDLSTVSITATASGSAAISSGDTASTAISVGAITIQ